ncbi:hypothetical protein cypCar_00032826 [Cyprinus carpio]|nr:hypothetical protein cypCar_00032826 [Cyprinus carpio]
MYLVIFPEGTRYNPELQKVISDSQAFAVKEGLAVLKHVLTPRMKASHVAIETMKEHLDAVYDITIAYEGKLTAAGQRHPAPTMPGFLPLSMILKTLRKSAGSLEKAKSRLLVLQRHCLLC